MTKKVITITATVECEDPVYTYPPHTFLGLGYIARRFVALVFYHFSLLCSYVVY